MIPQHIKDKIQHNSLSLFPIHISGLMPDDIQKMAIEQGKKAAEFRNGAEYGYSLAQKELEAKDTKIASLKSVMIAAAEEIQEHWQAHCDKDGDGPSSLMHRLEQGIPSQYGYTAGRFAEMKAELEAKDVIIEDVKGYADKLIETLNIRP